MQNIHRVIVPLAPLRADADDRAEQVSQLLYGEYVVVDIEAEASGETNRASNWLQVEAIDDGYIGWIDVRMVEKVTDYESPQPGSLLQDPLTAVEIDGRIFNLPAGACVPRGVTSEAQTERTANSAAEASTRFIGAPYLWGGKSILGIDCSGLVQLSAALVGISLPRDASKQALEGEAVAFDQLRAGDAVFFSKPNAEGEPAVTHVGWAVNLNSGWGILHASSDVHIDGLTSKGVVRDGKITHVYYSARRFKS
jgi:cell wall-associated NlpC family hydrolase